MGARGELSEAYVKKAIYTLGEQGLITRANKGGRGVLAIYKLTEKGEKDGENG